MKILIFGLLTVLTASIAFGQQIEKLEFCDCQDKIDQKIPALNGAFERICDEKLIEKGEFINGFKNGEWISYSKQGTLIRKINYEKGLLHGKAELFYVDGSPKLTAEFSKGEKIGKWTYYTAKGKILAEGNFDSNKPIGIWTINDKKGKNIVSQYDFDANKYLIENSAQFHKDGDIIQNENTQEWFILKYPVRTNKTGTAPIGGFLFAGDIFVELVEIPLDYWDTSINYKYKAIFTISNDNNSTFKLNSIEQHMPDSDPIYPFVVMTNPDSKIKQVEHSELSVKLLEFKINEALNLMPPWIYEDTSEIEIYVPYVINRIIRN